MRFRTTAAVRSPLASPALAQRGASCHGGQSFDQFLAALKQQAVAEGVSQRALAQASPYLVYDQSIVNRDRGQRVFGQIFIGICRADGVGRDAGSRASN